MKPPEDPIEALIVWCNTHVIWLRRMADSETFADLPAGALALDTAADELLARATRAGEHLELGDTAVLSIADLAEPGTDHGTTTPIPRRHRP